VAKTWRAEEENQLAQKKLIEEIWMEAMANNNLVLQRRREEDEIMENMKRRRRQLTKAMKI